MLRKSIRAFAISLCAGMILLFLGVPLFTDQETTFTLSEIREEPLPSDAFITTAFSRWLGDEQTENVARIYNPTNEIQLSRLVLYNKMGTPSGMAEIVLAPLDSVEIVVGSIPGFERRAKGILRLETTMQESFGRVEYRYKQDEALYSSRFVEPVFGKTYATIDNTDAVDGSNHKLYISNFDSSTQTFRVTKHLGGEQVYEETFEIASRTSLHYALHRGDDPDTMVVAIAPVDEAVPYSAHILEYRYEPTGFAPPPRPGMDDTGFAPPPRPGMDDQGFAPPPRPNMNNTPNEDCGPSLEECDCEPSLEECEPPTQTEPRVTYASLYETALAASGSLHIPVRLSTLTLREAINIVQVSNVADEELSFLLNFYDADGTQLTDVSAGICVSDHLPLIAQEDGSYRLTLLAHSTARCLADRAGAYSLVVATEDDDSLNIKAAHYIMYREKKIALAHSLPTSIDYERDAWFLGLPLQDDRYEQLQYFNPSEQVEDIEYEIYSDTAAFSDEIESPSYGTKLIPQRSQLRDIDHYTFLPSGIVAQQLLLSRSFSGVVTTFDTYQPARAEVLQDPAAEENPPGGDSSPRPSVAPSPRPGISPAPSPSVSPSPSASPSPRASPTEPPTPTPFSTPEKIPVVQVRFLKKLFVNVPALMAPGQSFQIKARGMMLSGRIVDIPAKQLHFSTDNPEIFSFDPVLSVITMTEQSSQQASAALFSTFEARAQLGDDSCAGGNVSFQAGPATASEDIGCDPNASSSTGDYYEPPLIYDAGYQDAKYKDRCDYQINAECPSGLAPANSTGCHCVDCASLGLSYDAGSDKCVPCSDYHPRAIFKRKDPPTFTEYNDLRFLNGNYAVLGDSNSCVVVCNSGQVWDSEQQDCVCKNPSRTWTETNIEVVQEQRGTCDGNADTITLFEGTTVDEYIENEGDFCAAFMGHDSWADCYCSFGLGTASDDFSPRFIREITENHEEECSDGRETPCNKTCQNPCRMNFAEFGEPEDYRFDDFSRNYCACDGEACCSGEWTESFCDCNCQGFTEVGSPQCGDNKLVEGCWCETTVNECGYAVNHHLPTCEDGFFDMNSCSCVKRNVLSESIRSIDQNTSAEYDFSADGRPLDNDEPCKLKCQCEAEKEEYFKHKSRTFEATLYIHAQDRQVDILYNEEPPRADLSHCGDSIIEERDELVDIVNGPRAICAAIDIDELYSGHCAALEERIADYRADPSAPPLSRCWQYRNFHSGCSIIERECTYSWSETFDFIGFSEGSVEEGTLCSVERTGDVYGDREELLEHCGAESLMFWSQDFPSLLRDCGRETTDSSSGGSDDES